MKKNILFIFILAFILFFLYGCSESSNPNYPTGPDDNTNTPTDNNTPTEGPVDEEVTMETIKTWLLDMYTNYVIETNIIFPKTDYSGKSTIEVVSFDLKYLKSDGTFIAPILDEKTELLFIIELGEETDDIFIPVILKGYGDEFDEVMLWLDTQIPNKISSSITLPNNYTKCNATLNWKSNNPDILNTNGTVVRDTDENQGVLLSCEILIDGQTKVYTKYVTILGRTSKEKIALIKIKLDDYYQEQEYIDENTIFYTTDEVYRSKIIWTSKNESIVTSSLEFIKPLYDTTLTMEISINLDGYNTSYSYVFKVKGLEYTSTWNKIETFLTKINLPEIKTQKFYLYGWEEGYQLVPTENIGYLPFYDDDEMVIIQDLVEDGSPLKPSKMRTATKYIVIHNTGMGHPTATASGVNEYIHSTDRVASWHFSIDDKETYQELKLGEIGWHAGESNGNNYGIGIESCVYAGVDFNKVMRRLAKLTAMLLIEYNLGLNDVKQHFDFSGKDCPQVIRHAERWEELLYLIQLEYFAQTQLKDVTFEWKSLTPEIMDDTGTVINNPEETIVNYEVKVTYQNETRIYSYSSKLLARQ